MFILDASKSNLTVRQRELMTSGSVNVNTVKFEFSQDWDGLTRTAVFRNNAETRSILLDGTNQCEIPREVLSAAEQRVYAGVYGTRGQETVLPTIWTSLGVVLAGAAPDGDTYPPTPELWEQELAKKQDKLHGEPGQLVGFDESGNAVAQDSGEAMQGPPGPQGVPGKDGKSAYQIAVENGFEGTEEEWLESLQGPPGKDGAPGPAGTDGSPGADGTTFTPAVSADGTLSWTNDGNMPNPEPVNIKGPAGSTEEPFITIKDKTIGTPASLIAILGRNSYIGCVHAINSSIIDTSLENDIVWMSFGLVLGTYYLTLITIDGYLTQAEAAGESGPFDITNTTTFVREDQLPEGGGGASNAAVKMPLVTLLASGWDADKKQTVPVTGVKADESAQAIHPTPAIISQSAYYFAGVLCIDQAENSLTFQADTVPTENLSVFVEIQEVSNGNI